LCELPVQAKLMVATLGAFEQRVEDHPPGYSTQIVDFRPLLAKLPPPKDLGLPRLGS
jgi:hypothetical protein